LGLEDTVAAGLGIGLVGDIDLETVGCLPPGGRHVEPLAGGRGCIWPKRPRSRGVTANPPSSMTAPAGSTAASASGASAQRGPMALFMCNFLGA
jgi:hypothetical protein